MGRLDGKVAVVTGAGGNIGGAIGRVFAREGAAIVVADIREEQGEQTVTQIREAGGQATFVRTDVGVAADVEAMIGVATDTFGRLDILVNNAARGLAKRIVDMTEEEWDRVQAVTLKSVFLGAKYGAPIIARGGGGSIVNITSVNGILATPGLGAYNAAKGGATILTKTLALELAMDNIRVNCILPGHIEQATPHSDAHTIAGFIRASPMGRYGLPEEIAAMALFLASDDASFATGASFVVDGGLSAQVAETVTVDRYRAFDRRILP